MHVNCKYTKWPILHWETQHGFVIKTLTPTIVESKMNTCKLLWWLKKLAVLKTVLLFSIILTLQVRINPNL